MNKIVRNKKSKKSLSKSPTKSLAEVEFNTLSHLSSSLGDSLDEEKPQ